MDANCLNDISDDETYHSYLRSTKTKSHSKGSTGEGEVRRDVWSGRSHKESSVVMDKWGEATNLRGKGTLIMPLSEPENSPSGPIRMPSMPPEDIRDDEHPLRQHPTRDSEGHILMHAAPTGSGATENTISMDLKTQKSSFVNKTTGVCYQCINTIYCPTY